MQENIEFSVLESLKILFNNSSAEEQKKEVFEQWKDWTLGAIYNYYIVTEDTGNKMLEIKEVPADNNTLKIKKGNFEF